VGKNHQFWSVRTNPKQVCFSDHEPETSFFFFKELNLELDFQIYLLMCGARTKTKDAFFERTGHGNCRVDQQLTTVDDQFFIPI
jgi:hypothetical protein